MLNLAATTDKLQLVTAVATNIDVLASWADLSAGTVTPGRQGTAISTATTTDVVASPGSGVYRNLKSLSARNRGSAASAVTLLFNMNSTLYEIIKVTLNPGDQLIYHEGAGFAIVPASQNRKNISTADQSLTAATLAVISGSSIDAANLKVGTIFRWIISMEKTAAGTAAQTFAVAFGTAGTTSDTARLTGFTTGTQTGVADVARVMIAAVVRSVSATGTVHGHFDLCHNLAATGFAATANVEQQVTSGTFDLTVANLLATVQTTPGASAVTTVHHCIAERIDP